MADNTKFAPQPVVMAVAQPVVAQPVLAQGFQQGVVQQGVAIQQPMMAQGVVAQPANHVIYMQGAAPAYGQDPEQCAKIMFIVGIFFGLVSW